MGRNKAIIIVCHILSAKLRRMLCRYCSQSAFRTPNCNCMCVFILIFIFIIFMFANKWQRNGQSVAVTSTNYVICCSGPLDSSSSCKIGNKFCILFLTIEQWLIKNIVKETTGVLLSRYQLKQRTNSELAINNIFSWSISSWHHLMIIYDPYLHLCDVVDHGKHLVQKNFHME